MFIQMPDDVESVGYQEVRPYKWEQVFRSKVCRFIGTEREFVRAGFAYAFVEIDKYTRRIVEV